MTQHILSVRVRPARVTILISKFAGQSDLLLAFEFLSRIWGGRFGHILPVDPDSCDDLTAFRLGELRPDFVYGIGIKHELWAKATRQLCQPRGYGCLRSEFVAHLDHPHPQDHALLHQPLRHLIQTRDLQRGHKQIVRLVRPASQGPWSMYCAAMFGTHYQNLRKEFYDDETVFGADTASAFIDLATDFVREWQVSWIDITGHELSTILRNTGPLSPTIVLAHTPVLDLSLFWNLRTASGGFPPPWIIPVPFDEAGNPGVLEKLKEWLIAFRPYGQEPNYCMVASESVSKENCHVFAEQLRDALVGTSILDVGVEPLRNRVPITIAYEYETTWPVEISGRKLTVRPPQPKAFENIGSPSAWFVNLCKDMKTGRAVKELQLPSSPVMSEILNGPCPPHFLHSAIPQTGYSDNCVNFRCSGKKDIVEIYLPTAEEVFDEILREMEVEPVHDEKRSSYLPVIERFGGLLPAATAFSGRSATVLAALTDHIRTPSEIRGICKLGAGNVADEGYFERIERMLSPETERMKRIARRRYRKYARYATPENLKLSSLLEHWADKGILVRQWEIGPCGHCRQRYFIPHLSIQRRIVCMNCGHRISVPQAVKIGYSVHHAVRHAVKEGIVPVLLTARFLRGLADRGFFWLPGLKYKSGDKAGDIDLLACCDGKLIFCECKRLEATPAEAKVWDEVVDQFLETVAVAKMCRAESCRLGHSRCRDSEGTTGANRCSNRRFNPVSSAHQEGSRIRKPRSIS